MSKEEVAAHPALSSEAMVELIEGSATPDGHVKGFWPHAAGFVGYHCMHEGNHRAQVEIALRQAVLPVPFRVMDGMWGRGRRRSVRS